MSPYLRTERTSCIVTRRKSYEFVLPRQLVPQIHTQNSGNQTLLLVACGEMGRTPRVNKRGGRDHWGGLSPLLLYGGGLPMGQVIGRSTADAGEPASDPVSIRDLVATIVHTQFDVAQLRVLPGLPKSIEGLVANARPIPGLI